jgi:hypothetical protein
MGAMDMMVERDYRTRLVMGAYHKVTQAWFDQTSFVPEEYEQALKRLLHCRRQQILSSKFSEGQPLMEEP